MPIWNMSQSGTCLRTARNARCYAIMSLVLWECILVPFDFRHYNARSAVLVSHRWIKWYLPQEQGFKMKTPLHIPVTTMWWFPQFFLSFPGSGASHSRSLSTPAIIVIFWFFLFHLCKTNHLFHLILILLNVSRWLHPGHSFDGRCYARGRSWQHQHPEEWQDCTGGCHW